MKARMMRKNINTHFKPCDNFYKFACGNFRVEDESYNLDKRIISLEHTTDANRRIMVDYLLNEEREYDVTPIKYVHRFLKKCRIRGESLYFISIYF